MYTPSKPEFYYKKVEIEGSELHEHVSMMKLSLFQRSRNPVSKDDRELLGGCNFQSDAVRLAFVDKVRVQ